MILRNNKKNGIAFWEKTTGIFLLRKNLQEKDDSLFKLYKNFFYEFRRLDSI